jgi:hypothetical protein
MERVASIVLWKEVTEGGDEPMAGGDRSLVGEPKFRLKGEESITGAKVREEVRVRVRGKVVFLNDNGVPFKGHIAFVRWEEE